MSIYVDARKDARKDEKATAYIWTMQSKTALEIIECKTHNSPKIFWELEV